MKSDLNQLEAVSSPLWMLFSFTDKAAECVVLQLEPWLPSSLSLVSACLSMLCTWRLRWVQDSEWRTWKYHFQASKDPEYTALCDISSLQMSCSKVFTSKYGKGFGLVSLILPDDHPANQPNSVYGIVFYSLILLMSFLNFRFIARIQVRRLEASPVSSSNQICCSSYWASPQCWAPSTWATSSTSSWRNSARSAYLPT